MARRIAPRQARASVPPDPCLKSSEAPPEGSNRARNEPRAIAEANSAPVPGLQLVRASRTNTTGACDIQELQRSHADMSVTLLRLAHRLDLMEGRMVDSRMRNCDAKNSEAVQRCILFARHRALAILRSGGSEVKRRPSGVCAANSVVQIVLKSQVSDCTLRDFSLLVAHIRREPSISCRISPSDYHAIHPSPASTSRLEIHFDSYKDICEALQMKYPDRNAGVYKKAYDNSRALRAIQVLGVHILTEEDRTIVLGRSMNAGNGQVAILHQNRPTWRENSWESDFTFRLTTLSNGSLPHTGTSPLPSSPIGTESNTVSTRKNQFAIVWETLRRVSDPDQRPEEMLGILRSYFPAVVFRTRLLTKSVQTIFDSRFCGRVPTQIIVEGFEQ